VKLLVERNFPHHNVKFFASARSKGSTIPYKSQNVVVEETTESSFDDVDIALFSAGGKQSKKYAPIAAKKGCVVVDNSSAFRMDSQVPLVIPEINPEDIKQHKGIIANPNCSTILMNVVVYPIHKAFGVERVSLATYQVQI
jgi:aspartate-semialdehyde dehydrogenase